MYLLSFFLYDVDFLVCNNVTYYAYGTLIFKNCVISEGTTNKYAGSFQQT